MWYLTVIVINHNDAAMTGGPARVISVAFRGPRELWPVARSLLPWAASAAAGGDRIVSARTVRRRYEGSQKYGDRTVLCRDSGGCRGVDSGSGTSTDYGSGASA